MKRLMLLVTSLLACGGTVHQPAVPASTEPEPPPAESSESPTVPQAVTPPARPEDRLASALNLPPRVRITTRRDGQVLVQVPGAAPTWEALRELGRKAHAEARREYAPTATRVHVWFKDVGAIATADSTSKTLRVSVGDGWFMSPDRATYELEVTYGARVLVEQARIGKLEIEAGLAGRATCEGTVRNLAKTPMDLSVRCSLVQFLFNGKPSARSPLSERKVYQEHVVALGTVAASAAKPFKFQMPPLPRGDKPRTHSLAIDLEVLRDGTVVEYVHAGEGAVADAWFRVLAGLAVDGVYTDSGDPSASGLRLASRDRLYLRVPEDMSEWPVDRQRALAKKIESKVGELYKLLKVSPPRLIVHARAGQAKIENGMLGEWAAFQM